MNKSVAFIIILIILFGSCKNKSSNAKIDSTSSKNKSNNYTNGDYCATVNYYYGVTGTNSTYTLKVEIEDNQLVKIYWPNGGWLDNSHFNPPDISDGQASFESDKGITYTVNIIGEDGDCTYSSSSEDEEELIKEKEEKKLDGVSGTVIWDSNSCDYVVIYTENNWYVIAEKYSGAYNLSVGDKVRGDLIGFGFEDVYCLNKDKEMRLYIDNYYATKSSSEELIRDKCNLNEK